MNRRGFLGSILALGAAPAIVKAEILMPVRKIVVVDHAAMFTEQVERRLAALKEDMERELMRNELADMVWDISPIESPFSSSVKKLHSGLFAHEWKIDTLERY